MSKRSAILISLLVLLLAGCACGTLFCKPSAPCPQPTSSAEVCLTPNGWVDKSGNVITPCQAIDNRPMCTWQQTPALYEDFTVGGITYHQRKDHQPQPWEPGTPTGNCCVWYDTNICIKRPTGDPPHC
jgi:hypothetical protein